MVARAARALGIDDGTVKGDIVVHKGEPYVIELAARLSGGFFCTREIPLNTGVDFHRRRASSLRWANEVSPDELEPKYQTPVIQRYAFPNPGKIVRVTGAEEARKLSGVADVVVTAKPGDIIPPAGDKRPSAAMVLATGASREAALAGSERCACLPEDRNRMNAPFSGESARLRQATLQLFALFHLNLAFSSIEEEQRGEVIQRCYWPLLDLAETHGPIGFEATGFTLEEIAKRDPAWIARARELIARRTDRTDRLGLCADHRAAGARARYRRQI